jgi:D-inositol-3-phosphate glycosyltransferase
MEAGTVVTEPAMPAEIAIAVLTGGSDRPYVFGLTKALLSKGATLDLIGSDELDEPKFRDHLGVKFFNLRGSQRTDAPFISKISRIVLYYAKLIGYAATAKPRIFHILWNNKLEFFDRTLLMLYYRLLGKKIVLTAHNVNAARRDSNDTSLNRITLRIQYRLAHHIFVHTDKMKGELVDDFGMQAARVTVIPFGINNSVRNSDLTPSEAKQRLGIGQSEATILFFGRITPYKGLEYLIEAFRRVQSRSKRYRLIVAGRPDNCDAYWTALREALHADNQNGEVVLRAGYIPDDETEIYFKAADVLVLPYRDIYQSGVLFLGHSFGLPVIAADVGSLKDDIVDGMTGFVFRPEDADDLAKALERYFASDLYGSLNSRRQEIRDYAAGRHSWDVVGDKTMNIYAGLLNVSSYDKSLTRKPSDLSADIGTS